MNDFYFDPEHREDPAELEKNIEIEEAVNELARVDRQGMKAVLMYVIMINAIHYSHHHGKN